MVGVFGGSCGKFGKERGSRESALNDVTGGIVSGVGNMTQAVEGNLTESEGRNNKQEQVSTAMFTELNKITQVLTHNREEARNVLVTIGPKLNGLEAEALTSLNTLIHHHSEQEWQDRESSVRHGHPKIPYHRGAQTRET